MLKVLIAAAALAAAAPTQATDSPAKAAAEVVTERSPEAYLRSVLRRDTTPYEAARALLDAFAMRESGEDGAALADRLLAIMRMTLPRETFMEAMRLLHAEGFGAVRDQRPYPVPVTPNPVSPQN